MGKFLRSELSFCPPRKPGKAAVLRTARGHATGSAAVTKQECVSSPSAYVTRCSPRSPVLLGRLQSRPVQRSSCRTDQTPENGATPDARRRRPTVRSAKKCPQRQGQTLTAPIPSVSSPCPHRGKTGGCSEEDVSTAPKEPETYTRIPQAHEHPRRSRGAQAPSPKGTQEAHGQHSEEIVCGDRPWPSPGASPLRAPAKTVGLPDSSGPGAAAARQGPGALCDEASPVSRSCLHPPWNHGEQEGRRGCHSQPCQTLAARELSET